MFTLEKIEFGGWLNCYRYRNDKVELVVTTDVGPRIIFFGRDGENELAVIPETLGRTNNEKWLIYGGHRFWVGPETFSQTYYPDNQPVTLEQHENFIRLIQPMEVSSQLQKEIDIRLTEDGSASLLHRLRNCGKEPVEAALWGITALEAGGIAIIPFSQNRVHPSLQAVLTVAYWDYSRLSDPRIEFRDDCLLVRQDRSNQLNFKIGISAATGKAGYLRENHLFIKKFNNVLNARYPDMGSQVEVFTNDRYLELETLGPIQKIGPDQEVEHEEIWNLECIAEADANSNSILENALNYLPSS